MNPEPKIPLVAGECPDIEWLQAYLSRSLSADDIRRTELHLADCEICSDVVDGLIETGSEAVYAEAIEDLNSRWLSKKNRRKRIIFWRFSAAASLLLLVSTSIYIYYIRPEGKVLADQMSEEQIPPPPAGNQLEQKGVDESADADKEETGKIDVDGKLDKTKASGTDIPFMIPVIEDVQEEMVVNEEVAENEITVADDGDFLWEKGIKDSIGTTTNTRATTDARNEREKQDLLASQENKNTDNRSMLEMITTGGMKAKSETDEQSKDSKKNEAASNEAPAVGSTTIVSCNQMIDQTGVSTISVNDAQAVAGEGWSDGISMDMELARGFFSLQQMDSATVYFSKVIETGSTQIWEARLFLARIAIWKDNPAKARILLKQVIDGSSGNIKKQAEAELEKLDKD